MPSCVVPTCKNTPQLTKKEHGITFHTFPADEIRKLKWTKILQRARLDEFWEPYQRSVICSIHFEEQYFYDTKCGFKRLTKGAIPTKHLALPSKFIESCVETPSTSKDVPQSQSPARSDSEIGDVDIDISDLISMRDSPREVKLKAQLRRKEIICERHVRRLKTIQQKYKRLAKRCETLKKILRNLKKLPIRRRGTSKISTVEV